MCKRILCLICFLVTYQLLIAQEVILIGQVIDAGTKTPLRAITVLLKDKEHKIIAFKASDAQGEFKISTTKDITNAYIEVNHLGYKKLRIDDFSVGHRITVAMEASVILLEDVQIKSRPRIRQSGDTLSYDVSSFAKEEDRSIGDVIKRMPGMEVSESGQIKYQGKAISNFYIDGDDLLADKYKIGTNTIKYDIVKDVQVLNNHEHMKVLKNKRYSDEVALNLVIKDEAKLVLSGQAKIGAGLPKQYDSELNTVLFNKKYKGLNVVNGNNIGRELSTDAVGFNATSMLSKLGSSPVNNLLSLGIVGNPPISKQHYLFNNSVAINSNNLINLKSKWQLVSNIQAVFEKINQDFEGRTEYITENNNYSFSEIQASNTKDWLASVSLKATKNLSNKYIENSFSFDYQKESAAAKIYTSNDEFALAKNHTIRGFKNKLDYVPALKNGNIIQLGWLLNYGSKPQDLMITPGVFSNLLNDGIPYNFTIQNVEVPTFFSHISAGYRIPKGRISQYYGLSVSLDDQQLNSSMQKDFNGQTVEMDIDSLTNNMHWLRTAFAFQAEYEYRLKRFSSKLTLPISYQNTLYKDPIYNVDEQQGKVLFNPNVAARYFVSAESELSFSYNRGNSFGNIENVYRGMIIRNYRSISNNSAGINESSSNNFRLNFKTGKSIKLMFYNVGLSYNKSKSTTLLSNRIDDDVSQTSLIQMDNFFQTYGVSVGFDKYIFSLASALKLNATINWTDYNQLFNDELLPFQNIAYGLNPSIDLRIYKKLNVAYKGDINLTNTRQIAGAGKLDRSAINIAQNVGFPFTVMRGLHLNFSARHLYSHQMGLRDVNYLFMDTFVRYRHRKWKTDIDLNLTNLANIKRFDTYNIAANMENQNSYSLRGRMAVLKTTINF